MDKGVVLVGGGLVSGKSSVVVVVVFVVFLQVSSVCGSFFFQAVVSFAGVVQVLGLRT